MSQHAILSPSSAERWMSCPGSVALEQAHGKKEESSAHADEGTLAHAFAEFVLTHQPHTAADLRAQFDQEVPDDMVPYVQQYVDRTVVIGGQLFVEQRLKITEWTDEIGAHGTSDAVILVGDELVVRDLKYGMGVKVSAHDNPQLMIYALAALREFEIFVDVKTVRICIDQPRLNHVSEAVYLVEELEAFGEKVKEAAREVKAVCKAYEERGVIPTFTLSPSDSACRWCKAKAECPSLRDKVLSSIVDDFDDIDAPLAPKVEESVKKVPEFTNAHLGNILQAADLIETWLKAVRVKAEAELHAGNEVPGFKLVEGKRGARQWADEELVEQTMKALRVKQDLMYTRKLISPTQTDKLVKSEAIPAKHWEKLQELIVQSEGRPTVAPESDKRPAITNIKEMFA